MRTVLIVEDEKMIRQGIRTMIQRCGVPVEVIMECANGEMALEMVKNQDIEVMFTDIRMPKMDGIQLVKEIQKLDKQPLIVAVSGYDDFSYAVEMLRNGVREYILKPVERTKISEIMAKLEEEIKQKEKEQQTEQKLGIAQIKHLLAEEPLAEEELELWIEKYADDFFKGEYKVCVGGKDLELGAREGLIFQNGLDNCNLCIAEIPTMEELGENEISGLHAGFSNPHTGIRELRGAYLEAVEARKMAFYMSLASASFGDSAPRIPEAMLEDAHRHIDEQSFTKRLHIIGTDKTEEIGAIWKGLFTSIKRGLIPYEEFEAGMHQFLTDLSQLYRNIIGEEESKKIAVLDKIYTYSDIDEYEENLMGLVYDLHGMINQESDDSQSKQKVKQAIAYIEANYDKDINMAVVSNEISMNYSLFSFAFKQYTGKNFVTYLRDLRIQQAKRLLSDTDMKIIDISAQVGYDNEKHFMKVFKTVCGVSPSEYRKNMSKN